MQNNGPSVRFETANIAGKPRQTKVQGFKYLWAKEVTGFIDSVHCARCLRGKYLNEFGMKMPVNTDIPLNISPGGIVYLCGVSTPYRWQNNFHLAAMVDPDHGLISATTFMGDQIILTGFKPIVFNGERAAALYPDRGREFLTCRNFQFGAHVYGG